MPGPGTGMLLSILSKRYQKIKTKNKKNKNKKGQKLTTPLFKR
jgi:hypothetical protein